MSRERRGLWGDRNQVGGTSFSAGCLPSNECSGVVGLRRSLKEVVVFVKKKKSVTYSGRVVYIDKTTGVKLREANSLNSAC